MKRKLSDEVMRDMVLKRLTKGDAFILKANEYQAKLTSIKAHLESMSREQIKAKWPWVFYDITE